MIMTVFIKHGAKDLTIFLYFEFETKVISGLYEQKFVSAWPSQWCMDKSGHHTKLSLGFKWMLKPFKQ